MNNFAKAGMLTIALGAVIASANSNAETVLYGSAANGPGRCQAHLPGTHDTIRNRVVGSENFGSPIAVACVFEAGVSETSTNVIAIDMWFSNNGATPINVNCTMLNGWQGAEGAVMVNKSVIVDRGIQSVISYDGNDLGEPDLGFSLVGVGCTLPTRGVINDTYVYWGDENGVGS